MSPRLRPLFVSLALALFAFGLAGCDEDIKFDPEFSVNLVRPGPKWPNKKKLTKAQKEAFEKYGSPDFLRVWWNSEGTIVQKDNLRDEIKSKKPQDLNLAWVYREKKIEVLFKGESYRSVPITQEVEIVMKHGDPEDVKEMAGELTQWMFYSTGKIYKFYQGRIVEEKDFPAMGRYLK